MKYGISIPNIGDWAEPRAMVGLAREAEASGWDGFFLWDHIRFRSSPLPVHDPWILLAAIATATERMTIGPMVTPLSRRRPWVVARQAVTLDHLSGGRLMLGVGLGEPADVEFADFGEEDDLKTRAAMLDEALAVIDGLWSGEEFRFDGDHYRLAPMTFLPRPLQRPRIPIIVAGYWPNRGPIRRAARWDGMHALFPDPAQDRKAEAGALVTELRSLRADPDAPFEIFESGRTAGGSGGGDPARAAEIGATWWIEVIDPERFGWDGSASAWPSVELARARVRLGPPCGPDRSSPFSR
jgi:alkanesulfonate monooxygenase SsuD/methylene tetrahydromethanopterin reductase-like flavin-dependent oxidoreductase (luciferase family)